MGEKMRLYARSNLPIKSRQGQSDEVSFADGDTGDDFTCSCCVRRRKRDDSVRISHLLQCCENQMDAECCLKHNYTQTGVGDCRGTTITIINLPLPSINSSSALYVTLDFCASSHYYDMLC